MKASKRKPKDHDQKLLFQTKIAQEIGRIGAKHKRNTAISSKQNTDLNVDEEYGAGGSMITDPDWGSRTQYLNETMEDEREHLFSKTTINMKNKFKLLFEEYRSQSSRQSEEPQSAAQVPESKLSATMSKVVASAAFTAGTKTYLEKGGSKLQAQNHRRTAYGNKVLSASTEGVVKAMKSATLQRHTQSLNSEGPFKFRKDSQQSQGRIRRTMPGGAASSMSNTSSNSIPNKPNPARASLPTAFPATKSKTMTHKKQPTPIEKAISGLLQSQLRKEYLDSKQKADFKTKLAGIRNSGIGGSVQVSHRQLDIEDGEQPETPRIAPPTRMESTGIPRIVSDEEKAPEEGEIQTCPQSTPRRSKQQKRRTKNVRNAAKMLGKISVAAKKTKSSAAKEEEVKPTNDSPQKAAMVPLVKRKSSFAKKKYKHARTTTVVAVEETAQITTGDVINPLSAAVCSSGGEQLSHGSLDMIGSNLAIKSEVPVLPSTSAGGTLQKRYTMGNRKESAKAEEAEPIFDPAPEIVQNQSLGNSLNHSFDGSPQPTQTDTQHPKSIVSSGKKKKKISRAKKQKESVDRLHYGLKDRIKVLLIDPKKVKQNARKTVDSQTIAQAEVEGDVHPPSEVEDEEEIRSITIPNQAVAETVESHSGSLDLWQILSNPAQEAEYIEMAESLNHSQRTIVSEEQPEIAPPEEIEIIVEVALVAPVAEVLATEAVSEEIFFIQVSFPVLTSQSITLTDDHDYEETLNFEESLIKVAPEQSPNVSLNLNFLQQFEQSHWRSPSPPSFEIFSVPGVYKTFLGFMSVTVEAGNLAGLMRLPCCSSIIKLALVSKGWKNMILQWADCLDLGELMLNFERGKLIQTLTTAPRAAHGADIWELCNGSLIKTLKPDLGEAKVTLEDPIDPSLSVSLCKPKPTNSMQAGKLGKLGSIQIKKQNWKDHQTKNMLLHQILNSPPASVCLEQATDELSFVVLAESRPKAVTRSSLSGIGRIIIKKAGVTRVVEGQIEKGELAGFGRVLKWKDTSKLDLQLGFWTTPTKTPALKGLPPSAGVPFGKWEWNSVTKAVSMQVCEKGLYAVKMPKKKSEVEVDIVEVEKVLYDDYILNVEPTPQQVTKAAKKGSGFLCCAPAVKHMKYELF